MVVKFGGTFCISNSDLLHSQEPLCILLFSVKNIGIKFYFEYFLPMALFTEVFFSTFLKFVVNRSTICL